MIDDLAHVVPWFSEALTGLSGTVFFRHLHARTLSGQVNKFYYKILREFERRYKLIYRKWPFVTESKKSISDLIDLGIEQDRIIQIPPGVDTDFYKPGRKAPTPEIVFFGRMMDYKQPEAAVFTFIRVKKEVPDSHFTLIGDGPALSRVRELIRINGLERDVTITGRLDANILAKHLSRAWVNIHCSVAEGWGYSIMEAAASGSPTVAYRVPGVSEVVKDNINGYTVELDDLSALSESVLRLLDNPDILSKSSRKFALKYSWEKSAELWENHLRNVYQGIYL